MTELTPEARIQKVRMLLKLEGLDNETMVDTLLEGWVARAPVYKGSSPPTEQEQRGRATAAEAHLQKERELRNLRRAS